jgi:AraC-like DNA-binding protein
MIEKLNGIKETVNFKENTCLRLYNNEECETYPNHWHTPLEIIMPIRDGYKAICGNLEYDLKEGDIFLINPGVIHSLPAVPTGERLIFQADFSLLKNIKSLESTLSILYPAIVITEEDFPSIHSRIQSIMLTIKDEYLGNAAFCEATIYALLIKMFVLIGREYTAKADMYHAKNTTQKEYTEKFLSLCNYINENCTKDLTLEFVADYAGFSKFHFTRLFKQFTGVSFYKYLNQKKIKVAENLLIDPDISITDVALHSGFSSLSAFIRMFKIMKSCTPTEFRNMYHHG